MMNGSQACGPSRGRRTPSPGPTRYADLSFPFPVGRPAPPPVALPSPIALLRSVWRSNSTSFRKSEAHIAKWFGSLLGGIIVLLPLQESSGTSFPLRWRWSNPGPHGGNIVDMAYSPDLGLGVQVAERGQLYTSDNLSTWLPRDSGVTNALRAAVFFGPRIIVTGEAGVVLYADSVADFKPGTLLDGPTGDWLEAVAASAQTLVAVGDNSAVYTSTNGVTWKRQAPSPPLNQWLRGVAFGNGTFVAVGENGLIATSPNGTNWTGRVSSWSRRLRRS